MTVLGIHFDGPLVTAAKVKRSELIACGLDVKRLYIPGARLAGALPTTVRQLTLPELSPQKLRQGLHFQVEALSHAPMAELVYTALLNDQEATIFLAHKETLRTLLNTWKSAGFEPDVIGATAQALAAFAAWRCPDFRTGFVVHLGMSAWTCIFLENGRPKRAFTLENGTASLMSALKADAPQTTAETLHLLQLDTKKTPGFAQALARARQQLHETLAALEPTGQPVLFTGKTDAFGFFRAYLVAEADGLSIYEPPSPIKQEERVCAIAIGSALDALQKERLQFLQDEFVPLRVWKKTGLRACFTLGASLLLAGGIWGVGQWQRGELMRPLESTWMSETLKAVNEHRKPSPYLLTVPTASETLAWLTNHPLLLALQAAGDSLEILDFRYELTEFPTIETMDVGYKAKVTVEFRTKWPTSARKFHDALLQEIEWVDDREEISWESLNDSYKTSFVLKQRAPHV